MKKEIVKLINKALYPNRYSSEAYIKYLRKNGCKVGENTVIYSPKTVNIDETRLQFIEIGKGCYISGKTTILAHDFSFAMLRKVYHCMPQRDKLTIIGDNVFIGIGVIILMGTQIGNNCIIGAGAVIKGNIPSGTIWGGNPARQIGTIEEYKNRLQSEFERNAKFFAQRKYEVTGKIPRIQDMAYYKVLFFDKNEENRKKYLDVMDFKGDSKEYAINDLMKIEKKYSSVEELINKNFNDEEEYEKNKSINRIRNNNYL